MLKHTEQYSESRLVRHYANLNQAGQVNGFRGETKELSEMKDRWIATFGTSKSAFVN
jgi:undecaprenyl-phosphate galactose phosphotransferase/putative colanic acid biosynthesis UDP-glucose lipid carrier transferase